MTNEERMTNEEAKELLKEEFEILKSGIDTADWESLNEELAKIIEANTMAIKALEQQPCEDAISRSALLEELGEEPFNWNDSPEAIQEVSDYQWFRSLVENAPPVTTKQTSWIPVSERLPEDLVPVNITWVNHEPEPYYHDIKDRNFEATGIHYRGQWYWYSTTCADYLGEYGSNDADRVDDAIEIVAWMPLPEPYKAESEG